MRRVLVLGSTGSIGTQALDVVRANPGRFEVVGLSAGSNRDAVQGRRLRIDAVGLTGADPRTARLEHLVDVEVP